MVAVSGGGYPFLLLTVVGHVVRKQQSCPADQMHKRRARKEKPNGRSNSCLSVLAKLLLVRTSRSSPFLVLPL